MTHLTRTARACIDIHAALNRAESQPQHRDGWLAFARAYAERAGVGGLLDAATRERLGLELEEEVVS